MAYRRSQLLISSRIKSELYLFPVQQPLTIRKQKWRRGTPRSTFNFTEIYNFCFLEQSLYKTQIDFNLTLFLFSFHSPSVSPSVILQIPERVKANRVWQLVCPCSSHSVVCNRVNDTITCNYCCWQYSLPRECFMKFRTAFRQFNKTFAYRFWAVFC